jgi:hypothetical protein
MRTVQQAQFRAFETAYVIRDSDANGGPVGLLTAQVIFDHPLREEFSLHRPTIDDAGVFGDERSKRIVGCRRDAVDHARWKRDGIVDPGCELGVELLSEFEYAALQTFAVIDEVVAADDRRRSSSGAAPFAQACNEIADQRSRCVRRAEVMSDVWMIEIERAIAS